MHLKSVSAFEVVGKQHCPSHDDKLKIQHGHTETLAGLRPSEHSPSITPGGGSPGIGVGECVRAWLSMLWARGVSARLSALSHL